MSTMTSEWEPVSTSSFLGGVLYLQTIILKRMIPGTPSLNGEAWSDPNWEKCEVQRGMYVVVRGKGTTKRLWRPTNLINVSWSLGSRIANHDPYCPK